MAGVFPVTNPSVLQRARSEDESVRGQAFDQLARVYYRPVYMHVRLKWNKSPEDAEELTQHFFVTALEREIFASYDSDKARFRTFVRVCIDRLTLNYDAAQRAKKRGGDARIADVDTREAEAEIAALGDLRHVDAEAIFERQWAKSVLAMAVERVQIRLEGAGRGRQFEAFSRYDLSDEELSYAEVAKTMDIPVTTLTNDLSRARKVFRECVIETLRELTANDDEFTHEARALGVSP